MFLPLQIRGLHGPGLEIMHFKRAGPGTGRKSPGRAGRACKCRPVSARCRCDVAVFRHSLKFQTLPPHEISYSRRYWCVITVDWLEAHQYAMLLMFCLILFTTTNYLTTTAFVAARELNSLLFSSVTAMGHWYSGSSSSAGSKTLVQLARQGVR